MDLEDYQFDLPPELIAQRPASPRDHSRLLVYDRRTKKITDDYFYNILKYLPKDTTLVVNNSKVEKCRLRFDQTEIFVLETVNPTTIKALVRPGRKFKLGPIQVNDFKFEVSDIADDGIRIIKLDRAIDDKSFDPYRLTPLPPYIKQDERLTGSYQTVYADPLGSKAAPTAGLHFTDELLRKIKRSHEVTEITLHVGLGTFAPVKTSNLKDHILHEEFYSIDKETAGKLNKASHVTAVGTTTVRTLESAKRPYCATNGKTRIFITPGYKFQAVDALITNFHLPKSSLLMLVAAFLGSASELHRIYGHAMAKGYRFYSFGDAMLIL